MHSQDWCRTFARGPEETLVCTGGAQLRVRVSTAESYHGAVRSAFTWADGHELALAEDDAIDRAL